MNDQPQHIQNSILKINQLKQYIYFSSTLRQLNHYCDLLKEELIRFEQLTNTRIQQPFNQTNKQVKIFTLEELSFFDGREGRPAYVSINGIVYDVSYEPSWGGATHFKLYAGNDLTQAFMGCHGNVDILQGLPKVGVIKKDGSE